MSRHRENREMGENPIRLRRCIEGRKLRNHCRTRREGLASRRISKSEDLLFHAHHTQMEICKLPRKRQDGENSLQ